MWDILTSHLRLLLEALVEHEDRRVRRVSWMGCIAYCLAALAVLMAVGSLAQGQVAQTILWLLASGLLLALTIGSLLRAFWLIDPQAGRKVLFVAGALLLVPAPLLLILVAVGFATGLIRRQTRTVGR